MKSGPKLAVTFAQRQTHVTVMQCYTHTHHTCTHAHTHTAEPIVEKVLERQDVSAWGVNQMHRRKPRLISDN